MPGVGHALGVLPPAPSARRRVPAGEKVRKGRRGEREGEAGGGGGGRGKWDLSHIFSYTSYTVILSWTTKRYLRFV